MINPALRVIACLLVLGLARTSPAFTNYAPPNQAAYDSLVVGKMVVFAPDSRLIFTFPGRIREIINGTFADGDYRYVSTGANTGVLTYTYDLFFNNPGIARVDVSSEFRSSIQGNFSSTITQIGFMPVIQRGSFELVDVPGSSTYAPTGPAAFDRLVAGKMVAYDLNSRLIFLTAGRLREIDDEGTDDGSYQYRPTGATTGTMIYTYDNSGNNRDRERVEVFLRYTSATIGSYVSIYTERGTAPVTGSDVFELVDVPIPTTSDMNGDGNVNGRDAQILYYTYRTNGAHRRTLLNNLLGGPTEYQAVLTRSENWRIPNNLANGDINEDDAIDYRDVRIMYYAYRFGDLLANSRVLREAILRDLAATNNDMEYMNVLRRANALLIP